MLTLNMILGDMMQLLQMTVLVAVIVLGSQAATIHPLAVTSFEPHCVCQTMAIRLPLRSSYGDSNEDSESDSESGSESSSDEGCAFVDLTYERLVSLQPSNKKTSTSAYEKSGRSAKRVKQALRRPVCPCACKIPFRILLRLCVTFWSLLKTEQDSLLCAIQHESGPQKKKRWFLSGRPSPMF